MPRTKDSTRDVDILIGERVRILRKMQGFTLKGLSEKLGISFVYLGQMERGEAPWKISMLSDVAGLLSTPLPLILDPTVPLGAGTMAFLQASPPPETNVPEERAAPLRDASGRSQRELARRVDVEPPAINRSKKNTGEPQTQRIQRLAHALQEEASAFLQESTPPPEKGVPEERAAPLRDASELAKKIRELREERGWSQRELARRLNMDPAALNRIENGSGNLHLQTIHRFANVFQADPNVFLQALASSNVPRADTAKDGEIPNAEVDAGDPDSLVGERVRSIRKLKGMTLKDLSENVGISLAYLGEMERGESPWKLSVLSKIAKVLNLPLTLLQDPSVPLERLQRVASILDRLVGLPEEQLAAIEQLLKSLGP